ncbi:MAG: DUF554 domain-containing protein [Timaviella obliquedivisa GSE-PSE-MK23-08B]|jgi:hypothetical protein|nr:DUF554 domain-containing protein [Timaviella obliquedivisa GSE-PSE-MK23-08B]
MTLDFLGKTSGTWINVATILVGTGLGLGVRGRLPEKMQQVITQGVGLTVMVVGIGMANSLGKVQVGRWDGVILGMVAMVVGGLLGEWWRLEERLEAIGHWLKRRFKGEGGFTEGFVTASLLFCIGPMAVIGSLSNGLTGDNTVLVLKSAIDGLAAIALTSSFGIGVGFSSLPILLYQGGLSLTSGLLTLPNPATAPPVILITGVGGLIIVGTGLNLLAVTKIRLASFLPALAIALMLYWLTDRLT